MKLFGTKFRGANQYGDFAWMIDQADYKDALFVFNDNETQFLAHLNSPAGTDGAGCAPGGGNAVIRPYQCRAIPRAAGIPTGPDYFRLTPHNQNLIDLAIAKIRSIIIDCNYKSLFYSAADETGALGTSIFFVGDDVKRYIVSELKNLETD